jgi:hypothetical protein
MRATPKRIAPATRKRNAPIKNGGNPSRATRIPKYVEPQMSETAAKERTTSGRFMLPKHRSGEASITDADDLN